MSRVTPEAGVWVGQTCWAGQAYSPIWGTPLHLAAKERGTQPTAPHTGEVVPLHLEVDFHFDEAVASGAREPVFSGPCSRWEEGCRCQASVTSPAESYLYRWMPTYLVGEGERTDWAWPVRPLPTKLDR